MSIRFLKNDKKIKFEVKGAGNQKIVLYSEKKDEVDNNVVDQNYGGVYQTGKCGDNVNYTLYDSGMLVIYGKGPMYEGTDWRNFDKNLIKEVKIIDGVTSIGYYSAFEGCTSLASITIPDSVTSIDHSAFEGCTSLASITIPDSVTNIGYAAFYGCHNLTSITIPDSVTSIGDWAFSGCSDLASVYYTGSQADWEKINIGDNNEELTDATIHYNYNSINGSAPEDWGCCVMPTSSNIVKRFAIDGVTQDENVATVLNEENIGMVITQDDLVPNAVYALMVVLGDAENCEITTDTLLYITDTTADAVS